MNFSEIFPYAIQIILIAIGGVVLSYLGGLLKSWKEKINSDFISEDENHTLILFEELVDRVVLSINQTIVDGLKDKGEFDKETQAKVFELAYKEIILLTSDYTKELIKRVYGDLSEFIKVNIEYSVRKFKKR